MSTRGTAALEGWRSHLMMPAAVGALLIRPCRGHAAAATGHTAPIGGALLQEAIGVAVILNALRTSR